MQTVVSLGSNPHIPACRKIPESSVTAGVYIIRCIPNNACYTGSSNNAARRLRFHVTNLRGRRCLNPLLQHDWDLYGESAFELLVWNRSALDLYRWEERVTRLTLSQEECGGYNKMISNQGWSLAAKIRDTERKLMKKSKFCYLPTTAEHHRIHPDYMETFCQSLSPFLLTDLLPGDGIDEATRLLELKQCLNNFKIYKHQASRLNLHATDKVACASGSLSTLEPVCCGNAAL